MPAGDDVAPAAVRKLQSRLEAAFAELLLRKKNVAALRHQLHVLDQDAALPPVPSDSGVSTAHRGAGGGSLQRAISTHLAAGKDRSVEDSITEVIHRLQRVLDMRGKVPRTTRNGVAKGGGDVDDVRIFESYRVVVFHGAEHVVFRASSRYTFGDLLADACHFWSLDKRDACLKDAFNGLWPNSLNVVRGLLAAQKLQLEELGIDSDAGPTHGDPSFAVRQDVGGSIDRNAPQQDGNRNGPSRANVTGNQHNSNGNSNNGSFGGNRTGTNNSNSSSDNNPFDSLDGASRTYVAGGFALSSSRGLRDRLPMIQLVANKSQKNLQRDANGATDLAAILGGDANKVVVEGSRTAPHKQRSRSSNAQDHAVAGDDVDAGGRSVGSGTEGHNALYRGRVVANLESVADDGLPSNYGTSYRNADVFHDPEFQVRDGANEYFSVRQGGIGDADSDDDADADGFSTGNGLGSGFEDMIELDNNAGGFGKSRNASRKLKARAGFETATFINGANLVTCLMHFLCIAVTFLTVLMRFRVAEFGTVQYVLETQLAPVSTLLSSYDAEYFVRQQLGSILAFDLNELRQFAGLFGPMQMYVSYSQASTSTSTNCDCGRTASCTTQDLTTIKDSGGGFDVLNVVSPSLLWVQACGSVIYTACADDVLSCATATNVTGPSASEVTDMSDSQFVATYAEKFGPSNATLAELQSVGFADVTSASLNVAGYTFGSGNGDLSVVVDTNRTIWQETDVERALAAIDVDTPEFRALGLRFNVYVASCAAWHGEAQRPFF